MNCTNCPDREICYKFSNASDTRDYSQLKQSYLRTLRCKRQRFG